MNIINFEKNRMTPLYEQVYHKLQEDILQRYLKKGDQLPSIRKAVALFKVSKTSVERAYEMLLSDGLIVSSPQKGYFVDVDEEHVDLRKHILYPPKQYKQAKIRYDFRSQSMDKDAFDISLWKRYIKDVLDHHQEIATYGDAQGEEVLRMALANYAYSMRGVLCQEHQIIIGSSFQSLLYILFGLLQGDRIIGMEEDAFLPCVSVCEDYHIPVRRLTTDEDGICISALQNSDVNILYINSVTSGRNRQPITKKRQNELLLWAKQKNALIIEDDHNGELRYHSRMTPAMQGFDGGKHILYVGSFSKLLLPSLRISYMVLNQELIARYIHRKHTYSPTSSKIEQLALAQYIADGHLERYVKRLRKRYDIKSTQMYECLCLYFKENDILLEEAALQFILRFPESYNLTRLLKKAEEKQIRLSKTKHHELVLSFAAITECDMKKAIEELYFIYKQVKATLEE